MDHIYGILDPYEPIVIPYLGGQEYDGFEFARFPTRQGWDVDLLTAGDLQGRTIVEAAQFLQAWLYFGMLYETLKVCEDDHDPPLLIDDFLRVDEVSQQVIVTTAVLPKHLESLFSELKQLLDTKKYYKRFRSCMALARGVYSNLLDSSIAESEPATQLLSPEILLSIQILGEALDMGITEVFKSRRDYIWRVKPRSTWLMDRMIHKGWCPTIVNQLSQPYATFSYFASLLGPPRRGDDHSGCSFGGRACVASNIDDTKEYVKKHVTDGCTCDCIEILTGDDSEVAAAIRREEIPVVHLRDDGTNLEVDICSYSASKPIPYTALSHVWADGLGSPNDNQLHRCQMKRLAKLLSSLPTYSACQESQSAWMEAKTRTPGKVSDSFFWMDTLCVPIKNPKLREKAIVKMRDVYECASTVLVLDAELMQHSAERDYREIFTRISCSSWARRLWTLQEGILSENLLFQFSDRAVYVGSGSKLHADRLHDNTNRCWDLVAWECSRYFALDLRKIAPFCSHAQIINFLWDAIAIRTTSRRGDEVLCLAILLRLDLETLQQEPDALTMKKFWSLHKEGVPAGILFIPGPKLQDEGYGWAPASLMDLKIMTNDPTKGAEVTLRGLRVEYPALRLAHLPNPVRSIIPCEIDGCVFYVRVITRDNSPSIEGMELHKRENLAILVVNMFPEEDGVAGGLGSGLGVLVQAQDAWELAGDQERRVKYLLLVNFTKKGSDFECHPNPPYSVEDMRDKMLEPVKADLLASQMFCVT